MNAVVSACGLQLYNFGQTVSVVFFTNTWRPDSFFDRLRENADLGMHTLVRNRPRRVGFLHDSVQMGPRRHHYPQNGSVSDLMTQGGKERMAGRRRGILGDWMFQTLLTKPIRKIPSCFGDPVSEFPLTYHCELIDEDSGSGAKILL
jgi:hypothetical protein